MDTDHENIDEPGTDAEFVDDAIDDEVSPQEQLLLDKKELDELGLTLDDPASRPPTCFGDTVLDGTIRRGLLDMRRALAAS